MKLTIEDVAKLCPDDRPQLRLPAIQGDYVYISDGKFCIRIKETPDFTTRHTSEINFLNLHWQELPNGTQWLPVPTISYDDSYVTCKYCKGLKTVSICTHCKGSREVECNYGHYHSCPVCSGTGIDDDDVTNKQTCGDCDGTGIMYNHDHCTKIGTCHFTSYVLYKLQQVLGALEIHDSHDQGQRMFRFDGGDGLIQTINRR